MKVNCNSFANPLSLIQDKLKQKIVLEKNHIPTSTFLTLDSFVNNSDIQQQMIWKTRFGGRDGFGVKIIYSLKEIPDHSVPAILEKKIDLCEEISVIVCRDQLGNMVYYPPVRMEFGKDSNQVEIVEYPAKIRSLKQSKQIQNIAKKTAEVFGCVGLLAIEMFIDNLGQVWVNEVAPRLHNSGHLFTEASNVSQAKNHLLAITGQEIIEPKMNTPIASMINIVGAGEGNNYYFAKDPIVDLLDKNNGNFLVRIYDYAKKGIKDNRKIGHIVILYNGPKKTLDGHDFAIYEELIESAKRIKAYPI
ncbi:ATP-grasp domain-containing protein [Candidatus Gracilibacteria bacterium]|nr:ATP-grasp domain-containing protein [Candidatus Gracilibacteria bacterium]